MPYLKPVLAVYNIQIFLIQPYNMGVPGSIIDMFQEL